MRIAFRVAAAVLSIAVPASAQTPAAAPQYVIISFDGAHDLAQWQRSRTLAARTGADFTYFLSCVFLLSPETRHHYSAPGKSAGSSNVGFARSREEVAARLNQIRLASSEGHEIASHGCGHFDGKGWTKRQWLAEFDAFSDIVRNAYTLNRLAPEPADWQRTATAIHGFRAPYLSTGPALYEALKERGFRYDASGVSSGPELPKAGPVARFSLPQIPEGPSARRVIAMDYNLFVRHSGGFERPDDAPAFEERAFAAFMNAFEHEYDGHRVPLQIGFHFTLMNGGAYWRALERFAEDVCVRPDVRCVSYRDYIDEISPPKASAGG
ncbi:MAG: polysaccharide deacetylase [Rhizobiaceae bacterium]|nr:polysaccharide deacetylase [Rhizobiaceae bacterium]